MKAIFRADANPIIGGGHAMRCLSLADHLTENGWSCVFKVSENTLSTVPALQNSVHCVDVLSNEDLFKPAAMNSDHIDLLIIDHYEIDSDYEASCRSFANKVLVIDDLANRKHDCDILLDQTFGRTLMEYKPLVPEACQILTGSEYALLRPQFAHLREASLARRGQEKEVRRIIVSLGMTDFDNYTCLALKAVEKSHIGVTVDVILGPSAPYLKQVQETAATMTGDIQVHVGTDDVAGLLSRADIAIGAGGSTSWERCCLGVPSLVIVTADNQRENARQLSDKGAIIYLEGKNQSIVQQISDALVEITCDNKQLDKMSLSALGVCDGRGVNRVFLELYPEFSSNGKTVRLRPATMDDVDIVFDWQTIPETRKYARNPKPPTPDEHINWFKQKIDTHAIFTIIMCGDVPSGILRLDIQPSNSKSEAYEVSILVVQENCGMGIGTAALKYLRRCFPEVKLDAYVKTENIVSQKLFLKAGYIQNGQNYINNPEC